MQSRSPAHTRFLTRRYYETIGSRSNALHCGRPIAALASCSLFGPSDAQISTAFGAYASGVATVSSYNFTSTGFSGTNSAGTVTITMDTSNSSAVSETFTFKDYSDSSSGYTINGTVTAAVSGYSSSSTSYTLTETGKLTYSGGPVTSLEFHVDSSYSSTGYSNTGYVLANGVKKYTLQ